MSAFVEVASTDAFQDGTMKAVSVEGQPLLVARVGGRYYAVQGRCPHMGGDLALGKLVGTVITCPRHLSRFDITDGRVMLWTEWTGMKLMLSRIIRTPRPLATYEVQVQGNKILVGNKKVPVPA